MCDTQTINETKEAKVRKSRRNENRFTVIEKDSDTPMTEEQRLSMIDTLANIIVAAYMDDHPELFKRGGNNSEHIPVYDLAIEAGESGEDT